MQNAMKQFLKGWLPPVLIRRVGRSKNISFIGPFESWNEAQEHSIGYESDNILEKVKAAQLKVKNGKAAYERDSVVFDKVQYSFPVTTGLLLAAIARGGERPRFWRFFRHLIPSMSWFPFRA